MRSDVANMPQHIAIVMDGNGRWAARQGKPRLFGHKQGAETLKKTVQSCMEMGIRYLTVYAFSTENWRRPQDEVQGILSLLKMYARQSLNRLAKDGICVKFIGNRDTLPKDVLEIILKLESHTKEHDRFTLIVAFNYGSREEIVRAIQKIQTNNQIVITEDNFGDYLDTKGIPDPDIFIRTSGEQRVSNFLLWQLSYAEFFFTDTLWPDFSKTHLEDIILSYQGRERRYGMTPAQIQKG